MYYAQKFILFLCFIVYSTFSYAVDSNSIRRPTTKTMHQVSKVDMSAIKYQKIQYGSNGDQTAPKCDPDYTLVHVQNASKQVFWGPPAAICNSYGNCSGFGCYCAFSPNSCCAWCSPPCTGYTSVRWQARPSTNQSAGATNENLPSVLSDVGCAPVKTVWEKVS